jgi:hypothetical protein
MFLCFAVWEGMTGPIIVPTIGIVFGYGLMRVLVFDLVDEVYFDGSEFVVRNGRQEDRFALANVINVDYGELTNPERITLTLREPCKFGRQITFSPPFGFWRFGWHPIAKELLAAARQISM